MQYIMCMWITLVATIETTLGACIYLYSDKTLIQNDATVSRLRSKEASTVEPRNAR